MLWVASGGAVGAMARHAASLWAASVLGSRFPWGTLLVNVLGSLVLGALATYAPRAPGLSEPVRLGLTTGVLGAFTTFSTFSVQTMALVDRGAMGAALANVLANVGLSLAAAALGVALVRWWAT